MSKEKPAFERCMELVQHGVDAKDAEYQELYVALNPDSRALLDSARRMMPKLRIEEDARQAAAAIREAIAPGGQLQPRQMWTPCAPVPTDMCRVSPFFPMRKNDMKERPFIRDMVITSNSWGEITYSGPKLSTYEEDVLLAVLALIDSIKNHHNDQIDGKSTYTYKGPLLPVLRLLGYKGNSYGGENYKHVVSSLKLMMSSVIDMRIYGRTTRGKRKTEHINITNLLSLVDWNDKQKILSVTSNPYFFENYIAGSVTLIDVIERAKLKSPIAKSLMRFMQSHRAEKWGPAHYVTLAKTLNMDVDQPATKIRQLLKAAIQELIDQGWLSAGGFVSRDQVQLTRTANDRKLLVK